MTVRKAIELIERNNKRHSDDIKYYNKILKKYDELNRTDPPRSELSEKMQRIFLDMLIMLKKTQEMQVQFNDGIMTMLDEKELLPAQDKISGRRKQVRKLFLEGYGQKKIAQKMGCSLSTVEKDLNALRKRP